MLGLQQVLEVDCVVHFRFRRLVRDAVHVHVEFDEDFGEHDPHDVVEILKHTTNNSRVRQNDALLSHSQFPYHYFIANPKKYEIVQLYALIQNSYLVVAFAEHSDERFHDGVLLFLLVETNVDLIRQVN